MTSRMETFAAELEEINSRFREIEDEQQDLVRESLPVESVIKYSRGDSHCDATVLEHCRYGGDRVYVRGPTGARYWIDVNRITAIDWVPDTKDQT